MDFSSRLLLVVTGLMVLAGPPVQDAISKAMEGKNSSASPSRDVLNHVIEGLKVPAPAVVEVALDLGPARTL